MMGLLILFGPTRHGSLILVVTYRPPRPAVRGNLRPAPFDSNQVDAIAAMFAALPPREA